MSVSISLQGIGHHCVDILVNIDDPFSWASCAGQEVGINFYEACGGQVCRLLANPLLAPMLHPSIKVYGGLSIGSSCITRTVKMCSIASEASQLRLGPARHGWKHASVECSGGSCGKDLAIPRNSSTVFQSCLHILLALLFETVSCMERQASDT